MRARDRRTVGAVDIPAVESMTPGLAERWVRGAPVGRSGERLVFVVVVAVVVAVALGPAWVMGAVIYASWWVLAPRVGPIRVSVLIGVGLFTLLFTLVMAVSVGAFAWWTGYVALGFLGAGGHAWRHGWIATEGWVYRVRDQFVGAVNVATEPRSTYSGRVAANGGLLWPGVGDVASGAKRDRWARARARVEQLGGRVHALEEERAAQLGWEVRRTPWGGREYRDPRFATGGSGRSIASPSPLLPQETKS